MISGVFNAIIDNGVNVDVNAGIGAGGNTSNVSVCSGGCGSLPIGPSNTTNSADSQPTGADTSYIASSPLDYTTVGTFPTTVNPLQVACGEDVCIIEALALSEARFHWAEALADALHAELEEFEEAGVIRVLNIAIGRTTNWATNLTRADIEGGLEGNGLTKSVPDPIKGITLFSRGNAFFSVRSFSRSTGGPTVDMRIDNVTICKIRLEAC